MSSVAATNPTPPPVTPNPTPTPAPDPTPAPEPTPTAAGDTNEAGKDTAREATEAENKLREELNKPKDQQDPEKIKSLKETVEKDDQRSSDLVDALKDGLKPEEEQQKKEAEEAKKAEDEKQQKVDSELTKLADELLDSRRLAGGQNSKDDPRVKELETRLEDQYRQAGGVLGLPVERLMRASKLKLQTHQRVHEAMGVPLRSDRVDQAAQRGNPAAQLLSRATHPAA